MVFIQISSSLRDTPFVLHSRYDLQKHMTYGLQGSRVSAFPWTSEQGPRNSAWFINFQEGVFNKDQNVMSWDMLLGLQRYFTSRDGMADWKRIESPVFVQIS